MNLEEALERIKYLENLIYSPKKPYECAKDVISKYFDVDLNSRTRKTPVPLARFLYFAWCRCNTTMSLQEIGRSLTPAFDHSHVLHGISTHNEYLDVYPHYGNDWKNIKHEIENDIKRRVPETKAERAVGHEPSMGNVSRKVSEG
jgi:chromosomal replication initiation ATPase DnaA